MEQVTGEEVGATMRKAKAGSDFPIGKLTRVRDTLPAPHELVVPSDTVKVTLFLSKQSVNFFKGQAARHRTKYQKMIRALVDQYTKRYSE